MKMFNLLRTKPKNGILVAIVFLIAFSVFVHVITAAGPWSDPSDVLNASYGAIDGYYDGGAQYLSIGGPAVNSPYSKLKIYSTSSIDYPLLIKDPSFSRLFGVKGSGVIVVGTTTVVDNSGFKLQVDSVAADEFFGNYSPVLWEYARTQGYHKIFMSTTTISNTLKSEPEGMYMYKGAIIGFDSISADSINFLGYIPASKIGAGTFVGTGGNFAFQGNLGVSTSSTSTLPTTLSVYDDGFTPSGYFTASTSIKITPPVSNSGMLNIGTASGNAWLSGWNKGIRLDNLGAGPHPAIELGGGGGTLFGIGKRYNTELFHFFNDTLEEDSFPPNLFNLILSSSSVGVGFTSSQATRIPSSTLHVNGTLRISGGSNFRFQTSTMTSGYVLTALDSTGDSTWALPPTGITGTGQDYTLRHNGSGWVGSSLLTNNGETVKIGTTVSNDSLTLLRVGSSGYFQFDKNVTAIQQNECGSAYQLGRVTFSPTWQKLYVCMGTAGWKEASFWYDTSFTNRKQITIDRSKVSGSHSNFPLMIKTTAPATAQDDCDDIFFTSADGTKLAHQIEKDPNELTTCASGSTFVSWVKIPSLSSSATTSLFMYYGSSTASNQQNASSVWDSNFKAVWHLQEFSSNGGNISNKYLDSTSNAIHASQAKGDDISTPLHRGVQLGESATTTDYIYRANSSLLDGDNVTVSGWVKFNSLLGASTTPKGIIARDNLNDAYNILFDDINNKVAFFVRKGTSWSSVSSSASIVTTGQWYHLVLTHTANTLRGYINGQFIGSNVNSTAITRVLSNHTIGRYGGSNYHWLEVDEVRYSDTVRSQEWITTEYNNQSSPATFYAVGPEE